MYAMFGVGGMCCSKSIQPRGELIVSRQPKPTAASVGFGWLQHSYVFFKYRQVFTGYEFMTDVVDTGSYRMSETITGLSKRNKTENGSIFHSFPAMEGSF